MFSIEQIEESAAPQRVARLSDGSGVYFAGTSPDGDPVFVISDRAPELGNATRFLLFEQILKFAQEEVEMDSAAADLLQELGLSGSAAQ